MKLKKQGHSFFMNTLAQTGGYFLYLLTRVGLPPLILHFVSLEEYGLWSTCFLIIGYISMGTFGISNVYVRYIAEYNAKNEHDAISGVISSGLVLTLSFGLLAFMGTWLAMPWIVIAFNIAAPLQETARLLILGTVAAMLVDMSLGAFAYVLHGLQKIVQQTIVWIISFILESALIVGLLLLHYGVMALLWAFLARYVFSTLVYIILCYRALPNLQIRWRLVSKQYFKLFLNYGGILQLTGLLTIFMYSIERLLAGYFSGLAAVATLDLGQKFPMMAAQMFSSMNANFLPALTHAHKLGQHEEIANLYKKGLRYLNLLNGLAMGFLAPFATWLLLAWLGDNDKLSWHNAIMVLIFACFGYQSHFLTGPLSAYYQALNRPAMAFDYLGRQAVFIMLSLLAIWYWTGFDVIIIASSVMLARIISALMYLVRGNKKLGLANKQFIRSVLLPGIVPYLWGYGILCAIEPWLVLYAPYFNRWQLIAVLAILGMIYVVLTMAFFYAFLCDTNEQADIKKKLKLA